MMTINKSKKSVLMIFSVLVVVSLFAINGKWLLRIDYYLFDKQISTLAESGEANQNIVVIAIDDYSLEKMESYAGRWVWPRSVHAELVEGLQQHQVSSISFDILLAEKDIYRPDGDRYLNEVLAEHDNVFFSMLLLDSNHSINKPDEARFPKQATANLSLFQRNNADTALARLDASLMTLPWAIDNENWRLGIINYQAEIDGIGRFYHVFRQRKNWRFNSLPATVAEFYDVKLPAKHRILLNWQSDESQLYKTYSYVDVYQAILEQDHDFLKQFDNKIVLVGATAAGLFDAVTTPINQQLPGVYMLATAIDNLLHQVSFQLSPLFYQLVLSIVLLTLMALCFSFLSQFGRQLFVSSAILLASWPLCYWLSLSAMKEQLVLFIGAPLVVMSFGFICYVVIFGYLEYVKKRQALTTFSRFLDPKVVLSLLSEGQLDAKSLSKKAQITILFSDIRGFTTLSEQCDAHEVLALLNRYFAEQVSVIFAHNGTLDKFIGDCIMAFWGAPVTNDNQAVDAIKTALAMQKNLQHFKQTLPDNLQTFDVGIGIHTGQAIAGLVGTAQRVDYTVIGDAVNLASRVEGLTKNHQRILVSEQTMQLAKHDFVFEFEGEFSVKGRQEMVRLYSPLHAIEDS